MELTKKPLIDIIKQISNDIDRLQSELLQKEQQISDLKQQNEQLKKNNSATLDQIREYIKELEQIRSHYVDSNNQPQ